MLYFCKYNAERKDLGKQLTDPFGRKIEYLRLSVTDRCDLRCSYCLPKVHSDYEEPQNWLSFDEIERLSRIFVKLGVKRIRLTGGEPLLRKNLPGLAARLSSIPAIEDLSLSTNATQLEQQAANLKAAGIDRINISLDALDAKLIEKMTGRDAFVQISAGIEAARNAGFEMIKINMVVLPGINDGEIGKMVRFCMNRGLILRLIEVMPMGDTARSQGFFDLQGIRQDLMRTYGLIPALLPGGGPARYLQSPDGSFSMGFITPISQHFCETCNRVRLSVDGTLYLCLGQEDKLELRPLLRSGGSDEDLEAALLDAIARKPERHEFRESPRKILRFMSATGG